MSTPTRRLPLAIAVAMFATNASANTLEEVVVTAQKRTEDVQDVPISISAYSEQFIADSGIEDLTELSLYTPNFQILQSTQVSNQRMVIRGVGSTGQAAIESSVAAFIDGVYYPRPGSVIGNLVDAKTVEVLRGPQGTLFGRNSAAGAINVTTNNPSHDGFEGQVQARVGNYGAYDIGGVVSGPISDSVAYRVSGKFSTFDGFGSNELTGEDFGFRDNTVLRGKLSIEPSDKWSILLSADYAEIESGGPSVEFLSGSENPVFLGTLAALFGPDTTRLVTDDPTDHSVYQLTEGIHNNEQFGFAADISYDLDSGHTIRSISSYREFESYEFQNVLELPVSIFPRDYDLQNESIQQEIQIISPEDDKFQYVAGVFYYEEDYSINQDFFAGSEFCVPLVFAVGGPELADLCAASAASGGPAAVDSFEQTLESFAAFGEATFGLTQDLSATLGVRYTRDVKEGEFLGTVPNPTLPLLGARAPQSFGPEELDDDQVTYRANLRYVLAEDVMLFATYSTGFKSSGFNSDGTFPGLTPDQRVYGQETTTNFELGMKSQWLENTLQANITAFNVEYDDFQDRSFDGVSLLVRNVGELEVRGIEGDVTWAATDELQIFGSFSFLDAEFNQYPEAPPLPGGAIQDLAGETPNYSPEWQASLVADWRSPVGGLGMELFIRGEYQFVDEQNVGAISNANPQSVQDAVSLGNARAGVELANGVNIALWGRNLTDEGYCTAITDQVFGAALGGIVAANNTTAARCIVAAPRTFGVEVNYAF